MFLPLNIAEAAFAIGDDAKGTRNNISINKFFVTFSLIAAFYVGNTLVHVPLILDGPYTYILIPSMLVTSIYGGVNYFAVYLIFYIWMNDLKAECRTTLTSELTDLMDVKRVIERYRKLKFAFRRQVMAVFSLNVILIILSSYVAITGNVFYLSIYIQILTY